MAKKKIIALSMIGMNRGSKGDSDHPFPMKEYLDTYSVKWLDVVSDEEQNGSTLFYEHLKAIDDLCKKYSVAADDVQCVFGRGTIGKRTERELSQLLQEAVKKSGKDAFKVILAKSFGVVDSLRALKRLGKGTENIIGRINLMFCIDGYATPFSLRSVSKKYKVGRKKKKRFVIPQYIDKVYSIVQRYEGSKGLKAGKPNDARIKNFTVKQSYVDSFNMVYDHFSDGFIRKLKVNHYNMDEIVSVIPCCKTADGSYHTFLDIISQEYERVNNL